MIIGIGTDIVDIVRMSKSIENEVFIKKVFSKNEISYCETKLNKAENYAARFAAKEAFSKALGIGFRGEIALSEIEVTNDNAGKPSIITSGKTLEFISTSAIKVIHVSLSHTQNMAMATVILEG